MGINVYRPPGRIILAPSFNYKPEELKLALNKLEEALKEKKETPRRVA